MISQFVPFTIEAVEGSVPVLFEAAARRFPDRLAIQEEDRSITYGVLHDITNRVAQNLVAQFATANTPLALMFTFSTDAIIAMLGALKAAKIIVMIDPFDSQERIRALYDDSTAGGIITTAHFYGTAEKLAHSTRRIVLIEQLCASTVSTEPPCCPSADSLSQIMYTSGSTGEPKGVVWNHRSTIHTTIGYINRDRIVPADRHALLYRSNSGTFLYVLTSLLTGASVFPYDVGTRGLPTLAKWLQEEEITLYSSPVSTFRTFVDGLAPNVVFPKIRVVKVGSERLTRRDVERHRQHFGEDSALVHTFGSTETGNLFAHVIVADTKIKGDIVPVGKPAADKEIVLIGEDDQPVQFGEIGEIVVTSRYLSSGYWRQTELTQSKFSQSIDNKQTYRTGDLGRYLPDGTLVLVGRKDLLTKVRGYSVSLEDVENALRKHPGVADAVARARVRSSGGGEIVGYVVSKMPGNPTSRELFAFLRSNLPNYMIPSSLVFLSDIPKTNGKVDRNRLPLPKYTRPEIQTPLVITTNETEQRLLEIWSETLDVQPIGIHDNFFDLGGHSLAASLVISRVIQAFKLDLPIKALFDSPTVAEMAAVIEGHQGKQLSNEELQRILADVESLSDEEAENLLSANSSTPVKKG